MVRLVLAEVLHLSVPQPVLLVGWMTAEVLRLSVPPLSNRGLAQTLHLWVVPRAEAVVWSVLISRLSAVVLPVGVKS